MSKARAAASKRSARPAPQPLGPGLHAAHVDLSPATAGDRGPSARSFRVRTLDDRRFAAVLADGVDPALVDECLRDGRLVIVADTPRGPMILGALQTTRSVSMEPDGTLALEGKAIRLRAEKGVAIEAGHVAVRMESTGTMRTEGDRMVIDMSSNVRVLSALVELP